MNKKIGLFVITLLALGFGIALVYGAMVDLSGVDEVATEADWFSANTITVVEYDPSRAIVFIGTQSGGFGYYNISSNQSIQISTISWADSNYDISALAYDSNNDLMFIGAQYAGVGEAGTFGYYNISSGEDVQINVSDLLDADLAMGDFIASLAYDSNNDLVFIGTTGMVDPVAGGKVGYYNLSSGNTVNISQTVRNNIGSAMTFYLTYDSTNDVTFIVCRTIFGSKARLGYYNVSEGAATNKSTGILESSDFYSLFHDSNNNRIYFGGYDSITLAPILEYYDITVDGIVNKADKIPWVSDKDITQISYDGANELVFIAGNADGNNLSFGYYNLSSDSSVDLNSTLYSWASSNNIQSLTTNSNGLVFMGMNDGAFGMYNLSTNTTSDLSETETAAWLDSIVIHDLQRVGSDIYICGTEGKFGIFNSTTNVSTSLRSSVSDWLGTGTTITHTTMTYDDADKLYLYDFDGDGDTHAFGYYNVTSGASVNLSNYVSGDLVAAAAVNSLAYDSANDLVFFCGYDYIYFNATDNTSTDLSLVYEAAGIEFCLDTVYVATDEVVYVGGSKSTAPAAYAPSLLVYNVTSDTAINLTEKLWAFTNANDIITALAYDNDSERIYIGSLLGDFGYYDIASNTTTVLTGTVSGWLEGNAIGDLVSSEELIYIGGVEGKLGYYDTSTGISTDLTEEDTDDWIGPNIIYALESGSLYIGGQEGIFGLYTRDSSSANTPNNPGGDSPGGTGSGAAAPAKKATDVVKDAASAAADAAKATANWLAKYWYIVVGGVAVIVAAIALFLKFKK